MKINRKKLLEDLEMALPGVVTGQVSYNGSDCFYFKNGIVSSFSGYVAVHVTLQEDPGITGTLPAVDLCKILKKIPSESVSLSVHKDSCIIEYTNNSGGKGKVTMAMKATDTVFIYMEEKLNMKEEISSPLPDNFTNLLRNLYINDTGKGYAGIVISDGIMWSINGTVICRGEVAQNMPDMYIGVNELKVILKIPQIDNYSVSSEFLRLQAGKIMYSIKLRDVSSCRMEIFTNTWGRSSSEDVFELPDSKHVLPLIERAVVFASKYNDTKKPYFILKVENNSLTISSDKSSGNFSETVDYDSPVDFEVKISEDLLYKVFNRSGTITIFGASDRIIFENHEKDFIIKSVGTKVGDYLLAPKGTNNE